MVTPPIFFLPSRVANLSVFVNSGSQKNYSNFVIYNTITTPSRFSLWSGAHPEGDDGENDKDNYQGDGKLEKGLFHAPLGAVDRVRLAEDAPQTSPSYLA